MAIRKSSASKNTPKENTLPYKGGATITKQPYSGGAKKATPLSSTAKKASSSASASKSLAKRAIKTTTSTGQKIPNAISKSGKNRVKDLW